MKNNLAYKLLFPATIVRGIMRIIFATLCFFVPLIAWADALPPGFKPLANVRHYGAPARLPPVSLTPREFVRSGVLETLPGASAPSAVGEMTEEQAQQLLSIFQPND